ncbi:NADH-quinone oxidoreductase subunit I [Granulicoccus phenolivorans]|uniref:NADH-quinone oxidoreductase subunit I n=1 Tax=Granulicoccus phenolivorans TaxID=266854 RepID=UPI0004131C2A|nr:4Fe-4S binding protein [Granulicoccus phenolivorans]
MTADGTHGKIRLIEENCTSCMICARECPVWCIQIDSHTEVDPTAPAQQTGRGMRPRTRNVLDRFVIDWSLCMYCGICVEECPFDALEWNGAHVAPRPSLDALSFGIDELA